MEYVSTNRYSILICVKYKKQFNQCIQERLNKYLLIANILTFDNL